MLKSLRAQVNNYFNKKQTKITENKPTDNQAQNLEEEATDKIKYINK